MPWTMGFQRNTQKPEENLHLSWFGAAREHASENFFRDFLLLGALWSTSGRALAALGRSVSALGFSLAVLGGHLVPKGLTRVCGAIGTSWEPFWHHLGFKSPPELIFGRILM